MKKIVLLILLSFLSLSISVNLNAEEKKMALNSGFGLAIPLGDMRDSIDIAFPVLISFQVGLLSHLSMEWCFYDYLLSSEGLTDYNQYQFSTGLRFWLTEGFELGETFKDIYFGWGLGATHIDDDKNKIDVSRTTFVVKGGYVLSVEDILLDVGARYDIIGLDDFFDQQITLYGMASFLF